MTIKEYVSKFGDHRIQLKNEVWHKCGLCQEEVLLDNDELHKHTMRHKVLMKDYSAKFIKSVLPLKSTRKTWDEDNLQPVVKQNRPKNVRETVEDIEHLVDSIYG